MSELQGGPGRRMASRAFALLGLLTSACVSGCGPGATSSPNVLLIVLDTTRPDTISAYGDASLDTTALDTLARAGVLFDNAHSTSSWSVPAHGSLFTGLFPSRHGAHWEGEPLVEELTTLAEMLAETHQTAGFSESPQLFEAGGFAQGFEHFEEAWRSRRSPTTPPITLELFARWLDQRDPERPFFVFLNLNAPHLPYDPPRPLRARLIDPELEEQAAALAKLDENHAHEVVMGKLKLKAEDLDLLRQLYAAEVAFVDEQVRSLIEMLNYADELENTLVVIVGDHGENIGDHGLMGHQFSLYESVLRVPLILRLPGVFEGGAKRGDPVQLVDVVPTVLDVLGIPLDRLPELQGRSLLGAALPMDRPMYAESMRLESIQVGSLKLIVSEHDEYELFDLAEDPGEEHDLSLARPEEVNRLETQLGAWRAAP